VLSFTLDRLVDTHPRLVSECFLTETVLRESGLDWTTVRPARLTDRPGTGRPVITLDRPAPGASVSRADVAAAMLQLLPDAAAVGHAVGVGRP
jgi:uncharacterized protein YbjT (DUF2867 family)